MLVTTFTTLKYKDVVGLSKDAFVTAFTTGKWYHVVGVKENSTVTLYVNGDSGQTTTATPTGTIYDSDEIFSIGAEDSGSGRAAAKIDDVRIYNYARTQEQIIEDMNAGHPAPGSPVGSPVLHLKFNAGYGDTANDSSIQNNDGDLAGTCPGDATCPSWTNDGKFGKALDFDLSDIGRLYQRPELPLT